ncbi:D-alanyl-D-alanine carboxypeptidase [Streptomyces sp. AK08-02]|uniref:D-alanyl-D-alanine carboxypeptidase n=1 Tax=Streptomyces sp. AK08-02 TaxID=3028654 RepID=UPI0039F5D56B
MRRIKEASVAGESPDRSKQRESSEEPTSGSAGPVPGARGESGAGARDPRLAVARDRESPARGGVDTATRVFQRPQVPGGAGGSAEDADTEGTAPEAASEPEAAAEAAGSGSAGGTDGTGSTRLRAAVAAWVSGADEGEGEGVEGAAEEPGPDTDANPTPDAETPADAPEGDEEPAEGATGDAGPEEPSEASGEAPEAGAGASVDTVGAASGPESPQKPEPEQSRKPQTDSAPTPKAEPDTGTAAGTGGASASASESEADQKRKAATGNGSEPEAESGSAAGAAAGAESGTGPKPVAESAPKSAADVRPGSVTDAESAGGDRPESVTDAAPKSGTAPESGSAADSGPESDAEAEADADGNSAPAPAPAPDDDADADGNSAPGADADSDSAPVTGKASGGAASESAADKPPVDQPTAVFKVARPPVVPAVDQPTTMLKLGDLPARAGKGAGEPKADDAGAEGKGESVAERTSKFVALRQLDDPATRKAPPAVPPPGEPGRAPAAQPAKVTPAEATAVVPQVGPERTTQQPLPPLPPLDLLAELTNTPPPRDTAVRTIARRVKIWTPVAILLAIVFAVVQALRPLPAPELTLTAKDSYTFDGTAAALPWPTDGQGWMDVNGIGTMGKFGEQKPVAIGSVAKAMTAYLVLKDHPLKVGEEGPKIRIDATAEKEGGYDKDGKGESTLNTVKTGDTLTLKQALSAVMIPSANNIARLLARWDDGTEAAFIKKMNDTAKELGMKNTTYTDASGLKETTVSTAEDQVKLGNKLVRMPALMDITRQPFWYDPTGKKWRNYNEVIPANGGIGIKTGTTSAAGGNLLFAATKEVGGETAIVVGAILGQHTAPIIDTVNNVSRTAMIAAREALLSSKILKKGDVVGYVDDGLGGQTPVVLSKDVTAIGWAGRKVELSFAAADDLPHSAKAGTAVGTLTVGDGAGGAVKVPVQLQKDLAEPGFDKKLTRVG